jgi:hypothetical protein
VASDEGKHSVIWRGKPLEECSRDELLECVRWLAFALESEMQWSRSSAETYDALLRAKPSG